MLKSNTIIEPISGTATATRLAALPPNFISNQYSLVQKSKTSTRQGSNELLRNRDRCRPTD